MDFQSAPCIQRQKIADRFALGDSDQWFPFTSVQELIDAELQLNAGREEPEDEATILRQIYAWMGEQLELTEYLVAANSPEGKAAYEQQMRECNHQLEQAHLQNAAAYEASRGPYDDYEPAPGLEADDTDDERGDSEY